MKIQRIRQVGEALAECIREMQVRERCYDRWVADGKMTDVDAQDRFDRLGSAVQILTDIYSTERAATAADNAQRDKIDGLQESAAQFKSATTPAEPL